MDGHGNVNTKSWSIHDSSPIPLKGHLGLQLMSSMVEENPLMHGASGGSVRGQQQPLQNHHHHQQQQSLHQQNHHGYPALMTASNNGGLFHHHFMGGIMDSSVGMGYLQNPWLNFNKELNLNLLSNNNHHHANYGLFSESSSAHSVEIQPTNGLKNQSEPLHPQLQDPSEEREDIGTSKKRGASTLLVDKSPRAKKSKRASKAQKDESTHSVPRIRAPKKSVEVVINGISMDISGIPIPVCTCTGSPQQCYRWGSGGWQSACCTTLLSGYPLPMNSKRRGVRVAGRKMSVGAFKKVLEKLASEGYNFSNPIDLRSYWAKHGTNKFVTIR